MTYLDKPWLKSYKLGPYRLDESLRPYPREPLFRILDDAAEQYPGQTAVLFEDRSINYRQLKTLTDRLAAGLASLGVERGDRVCLFLPNCVEFIVSDWAILKAGAAVVPTSVLRTEEGLIHDWIRYWRSETAATSSMSSSPPRADTTCRRSLPRFRAGCTSFGSYWTITRRSRPR
jgi:non-ribosomal peptide synthetase component F